MLLLEHNAGIGNAIAIATASWKGRRSGNVMLNVGSADGCDWDDIVEHGGMFEYYGDVVHEMG